MNNLYVSETAGPFCKKPSPVSSKSSWEMAFTLQWIMNPYSEIFGLTVFMSFLLTCWLALPTGATAKSARHCTPSA